MKAAAPTAMLLGCKDKLALARADYSKKSVGLWAAFSEVSGYDGYVPTVC
jgi:hypothetical protein